MLRLGRKRRDEPSVIVEPPEVWAIQALLFPAHSWSPKRAAAWIVKHNHHPIEPMRRTDNYLRYRLMPPEAFKRMITGLYPGQEMPAGARYSPQVKVVYGPLT